VRPPRAVFLPWPLGQPLGEPDQPAQQRWVIQEAFALLEAAEGPGALIEPDGNWEKHSEIVR